MRSGMSSTCGIESNPAGKTHKAKGAQDARPWLLWLEGRLPRPVHDPEQWQLD